MRVLHLAVLSALIFPTLLAPPQPLPRALVAAPVSASAPVVSIRPAVEVAEESPFNEQDLRCLALNIYHEARSEPESGQIAVARVTLNRVASNAFPGSICAVVKQGGVKRNRCQFSWWCDGQSDQPKNQKAWRRALEIARRVIDDADPDPTKGALYYHATYSKPSWSRVYKRTTRIGQHLFYRPKSI